MILSHKFIIIIFIIPIISSILIQYILFSGIEVPPSTYGNGNMFDTIANRYDLINRVLAIGMDISWRQKMVNIIKNSVSKEKYPKILDIATGTADVAIQLYKNIPNSYIIGIDPSINMLNIGKQKIINNGYNSNQINLQYADAQNLYKHFFPNNTTTTTIINTEKEQNTNTKSYNNDNELFDAATISFGIRNIPNRTKALCEINNLLKINTKFCILEFSEPINNEFGILGIGVRYFIRYIVPIIGGILSNKPREYWHLQKSINDFPSYKEFINIIENVNCSIDNNNDNDNTPIKVTSFKVDELIQLNFGSVQLYVTTKIIKQ